MIKQIRCCNCGALKWMRGKYLKVNFAKFNVNNIAELHKKYLCRPCRINLRPFYYVSGLKSTFEFRKLRSLLQEEVYIYEKRGLDNVDARNNFLLNIKNILAKYYITEYSFVVKNTVLLGIEILNNIPIFGKIVIELESKGNKHDIL